jgi:hypothetical protein
MTDDSNGKGAKWPPILELILILLILHELKKIM